MGWSVHISILADADHPQDATPLDRALDPEKMELKIIALKSLGSITTINGESKVNDTPKDPSLHFRWFLIARTWRSIPWPTIIFCLWERVQVVFLKSRSTEHVLKMGYALRLEKPITLKFGVVRTHIRHMSTFRATANSLILSKHMEPRFAVYQEWQQVSGSLWTVQCRLALWIHLTNVPLLQVFHVSLVVDWACPQM